MSRWGGGVNARTAALRGGSGAGGCAGRSATPVSLQGEMRMPQPLEQTRGDYYLVVYPSPVLGDGRGANKPWLQELPDPVTKVLWSSWVELHPETATRLGIERGDILEVGTGNGKVRAPAYLYLGIRPDTIALATGQGHSSAVRLDDFDGKHNDRVPTQWGYGRYARNIGVRAHDLLGAGSDNAGGFALVSTKATLAKTGDHETLVSTEGSARQHGRGIGQALLVTELSGVTQAPGAENANALAPQGSKNQESGTGASQGEHAGGKTEGNRGEHAEEIPGEPKQTFLPGLRSPVAADAQGELGAPTAADRGKDKGMYAPNHWSGMANR